MEKNSSRNFTQLLMKFGTCGQVRDKLLSNLINLKVF